MELYRILTRPPTTFTCVCDSYLLRLYREACFPALPESDDDLDIANLAKLEVKLFFPAKAVQSFVTPQLLDAITRCECASCGLVPPNGDLSGIERSNLMRTILENLAQASSIVANLIYLREARRLYQISKLSPGLANGIDSVAAHEGLRNSYPAFASNFSRTKLLFQPPTLLLGDTTCDFESGTRLPFLDEEEFDGGSFGVVTKFKIHPDYINKRVRLVAAKYFTRPHQAAHDRQEVGFSQLLHFARKTIQGARDQSYKDHVELERDVLGVIASQTEENKTNLIDLIAFYSFGDELNLVFPFVPGSLEKYLAGDWDPEHIKDGESFPKDWVTTGLTGLANGLEVIHHPPTQNVENHLIRGYHFDLKPSNILITSAGVFKITDFGQSLIRVVHIGENSSGDVAHDGGDPVYAPPEDMPTREQVKRSSKSYKYAVDSTTAPQIVLSPSANQPGGSSAPHLSVPPDNPQTRLSSRSSIVSQQAMGSAEYDIWSLACVMLLVLTHKHLGGPAAVRNLRTRLKWDKPNIGYHTGQLSLKACVEEHLRLLKDGGQGQKPRTSSMQAYMSEIITLIGLMFKIDKHERPSAVDVAEALETAVWNYQNSAHDSNGLLAAIRDHRGPTNDYTEVASDGLHTSFMYMNDIKVSDPSGGAGFDDCRFKIFALKQNKIDGIKAELLVIIASLQDGKIEFQQCPFLLKDWRFYPLYLFTSRNDVESWQRCCRLATDGSSKTFWFGPNLEGLLAFQAVFFQHAVEPGNGISDLDSISNDSDVLHSVSTPSKVFLEFKSGGKQFEATARAMQIWTARKRSGVSRARSETTLSSGSSGQGPSGVRLVLFLRSCKSPGTRKSYDLLQIPLESYIATIIEGDQQDGSTTSLTFLPKTPASSNSVFKAILSETSDEVPNVTSLSLKPQEYRFQQAPTEEQKARRIKIVFQNHSAIQTIRGHFDIANQKNDPKTTWQERR